MNTYDFETNLKDFDHKILDVNGQELLLSSPIVKVQVVDVDIYPYLKKGIPLPTDFKSKIKTLLSEDPDWIDNAGHNILLREYSISKGSLTPSPKIHNAIDSLIRDEVDDEGKILYNYIWVQLENGENVKVVIEGPAGAQYAQVTKILLGNSPNIDRVDHLLFFTNMKMDMTKADLSRESFNTGVHMTSVTEFGMIATKHSKSGFFDFSASTTKLWKKENDLGTNMMRDYRIAINELFEVKRLIHETTQMLINLEKSANKLKMIIDTLLGSPNAEILSYSLNDIPRVVRALNDLEMKISNNDFTEIIDDVYWFIRKLDYEGSNHIKQSSILSMSNKIGLIKPGPGIKRIRYDSAVPSDIFSQRIKALKGHVGIGDDKPISVGVINLRKYIDDIEQSYIDNNDVAELYHSELVRWDFRQRGSKTGFGEYMRARFRVESDKEMIDIFNKSFLKVKQGDFALNKFLQFDEDFIKLFKVDSDDLLARTRLTRILGGSFNSEAISFTDLRGNGFRLEVYQQFIDDIGSSASTSTSMSPLSFIPDEPNIEPLDPDYLIENILRPLFDIIGYSPSLEEAIISIVDTRQNIIEANMFNNIIDQIGDITILESNLSYDLNITSYVYRFSYLGQERFVSEDMSHIYSNNTRTMLPIIDGTNNWNELLFDDKDFILPDFQMDSSESEIMKHFYNLSFYKRQSSIILDQIVNAPILYFILSGGDLDYLMAEYEIVRLGNILKLGDEIIYGNGEQVWSGGEMALSIYQTFLLEMIGDDDNEVVERGSSMLSNYVKGLSTLPSYEILNEYTHPRSNLNKLIDVAGFSIPEETIPYNDLTTLQGSIGYIDLDPVLFIEGLIKSPTSISSVGYTQSSIQYNTIQQFYGTSDRYPDLPYRLIRALSDDIMNQINHLNSVYGLIEEDRLQKLSLVKMLYRIQIASHSSGIFSSLFVQYHLEKYGIF